MEFNREQQQAMEHKDGPMLVLAGPGSGKTEVIIRRTRKLIQNYQVAPSSILVVTFTKAAAGQMRERFLHLCGVKKSQVTFGTFHAGKRDQHGKKRSDPVEPLLFGKLSG